MLRLTRHNEEPFEMTAELIHFLESLPGTVTFVNIHGEVLVRIPDETGQADTGYSRSGVRPSKAGRRAVAAGVNHAK